MPLPYTRQSNEVLKEVDGLIQSLAQGQLNKADEMKLIRQSKLFGQKVAAENLELQDAALVGGGILGLVLGLFADVSVASTVQPFIAPLTIAVVIPTALYYLFREKKYEKISDYAKEYLGKPTLSAKENIVQAVNTKIENVKESTTTKINNTKEFFIQLPANTKAYIIAKWESFIKKITDTISETIAKVY